MKQPKLNDPQSEIAGEGFEGFSLVSQEMKDPDELLRLAIEKREEESKQQKLKLT